MEMSERLLKKAANIHPSKVTKNVAHPLEQMDMKVLQFQNKKLVERIDQRKRAEEELHKRIEQLENRQRTDDAVLMIVNRYWNQLDEDVRVLVQRFDAETADEDENKNQSTETTSFLALLSTWDRQELEQRLGQRRQEISPIKQEPEVKKESEEGSEVKQEPEEAGGDVKVEVKEEPMESEPAETSHSTALASAMREELQELQMENKRLHNLVTDLHQRHHQHTLKVAELQDKLTAAETEIAELKNKVEDAEYNYQVSSARAEKLDRYLSDALQKLQNYEDKNVIQLEGGKSVTGVSKNKLQHLPESVIVETTEYKCLQSQFSVLYNESLQMKTLLDESRTLVLTNKNAHLRQIEQMESDELSNQKKLRTEVIQLEDALGQVRKAYEMLRIEFEQTLAAHEQTGSINQEMRNLIQSLQKHNQQLKAEAQRNRRKVKECQSEINKLKEKMEELQGANKDAGGEEGGSSATGEGGRAKSPRGEGSEPFVLPRDDDNDDLEKEREKGKSDAEIFKDLKAQLKKSQDAQKELKLLLDMYKAAPKEQRDKVQLMACEKRLNKEIDDLRQHIKKMQESERRERKKLAEEDALRKIKKLEETIQDLQKNLATQKQREDVLLSEMDATGQAFEDMQEQNTRLLQQLREKDDANFKLMSERIKGNQIQKLLREEKEVLGEQVSTIHLQVEAHILVVRKLEEKERAMELHKRKAVESAQTAADLKLHLDKYQAQLREAQVAVAEKTGAIEQEAYKYKRTQEEIAKLQRKLERSKKIEMAGAADEEQLTCPSCKVNRKDAVLTKCFHLDEDVRVLVQRFDAETADEDENKNQSTETTSFLALLSTWDRQELEQRLGQRVEFSKRAIGKLLQAFDRLLQRNEKLHTSLPSSDIQRQEISPIKQEPEVKKESEEGSEVKQEPEEEVNDAKAGGDVKVEVKEEPMESEPAETSHSTALASAMREELQELQMENKRLHNLVTDLHQRHHQHTLKVAELQDKLTAAETEIAELKNKVEDAEYNYQVSSARAEKLDRYLSDALQKLQNYEDKNVIQLEGGKSVTGVSKNKLQHLPESVIVETTEYKCLQSQFSVLYNESLQMKTLLDESRTLSDELSNQKKLRTEVIQLEDALGQVRKAYEMLRIEFEQTLAAHEQTGSINQEMRNLIQSLQKHNQQLKAEAQRNRRKVKECQSEINKLKEKMEELQGANKDAGGEEGGSSATGEGGRAKSPRGEGSEPFVLPRDDDNDDLEKEREKGKSDAEIFKDLKAQLKKSQDAQKELKLLLDMYKAAPKEQRDKVQLMACEKRLNKEIDDLRQHIKKMQESERRERKKLAEEDALRKIKKLEETIQDLQKNLATQKQREDVLLSEMDATGQAFEDMQEQNTRLLQQLREKDDANFKLMSERIKGNQIQKLLREEKEVLGEQVSTIHLQVEAHILVVRKLEEKERAMELHKRKAVESAQTAADLKLHLDKYQAQLREAQVAVAEKTGAIEQEAYKYKRTQEEIAKLQRKLERSKKIEMAGAADEEQLTCPSCKVNRKDAVLTKCFHVFCLECLKTRYETRQRKCPKCNAGFGANDYHRLYLT
ncbi:BRE1B-like protein [Mya arenaria]|uniref:E3 ubiquitin-protein ligase BRE1 n=1 Tax=Mya arenaria TaxID=6604 RepID=A0ABY7DUY7_MYAAR|nr:BRE1B-like protein [Mya arenaria]